jgi:Transglutaminase-like enzymes, putative cysteine proteases
MKRYITPAPELPRISLESIPKGYLGTRKTLEHIQALIRQGVKDFYIRQKAIDILFEKGIRAKDYLGEIKALFEWVQQNVRYTKDPFRLEVLHSARRILELRAGDCDDMTIVLGAMLESIGHPIRLVIVGPAPFRPDLFSHIYLEVYYKGRWIPLDATMPFPMGWAPRTFVKQIISMDRRPNMLSEFAAQPGSTTTQTVPDWLRGLIRAVRQDGMQPRDERVRTLWNLLRQRGLLSQSPWMRATLLYFWQKGLVNRARPITTWRLKRKLRRWGILPVVGTARPWQSATLPPVQGRSWAGRIRPLEQRGGLRPIIRRYR